MSFPSYGSVPCPSLRPPSKPPKENTLFFTCTHSTHSAHKPQRAHSAHAAHSAHTVAHLDQNALPSANQGTCTANHACVGQSATEIPMRVLAAAPLRDPCSHSATEMPMQPERHGETHVCVGPEHTLTMCADTLSESMIGVGERLQKRYLSHTQMCHFKDMKIF